MNVYTWNLLRPNKITGATLYNYILLPKSGERCPRPKLVPVPKSEVSAGVWCRCTSPRSVPVPDAGRCLSSNIFCYGNGESMVTDRFVHRPGMNMLSMLNKAVCTILCRKCATSRRRDIAILNRSGNYGKHDRQDGCLWYEQFARDVCSCRV